MRVLVVCNGFPPSGQWGTEFYSHQLATGLASRGDEVAVLHPVRGGGRPRFALERTRRYGLDVHELANEGDPRKPFADSYRSRGVEQAFDRLLVALRPEVVHFTHLLWGLSARLPAVAKARGARTVVTVTDHGLVCHRGQLLDWRLRACEGPGDAGRCARCVREPGPWDAAKPVVALRRLGVRGAAACGGLGRIVGTAELRERARVIAGCVRAVDRWILPTRAVERSLAAFALPRERTTRLVYGIDEARFAGPREPAAPGEGTRFVFMSQYLPHKGLAVLLAAARELAAAPGGGPWRLDLHGNGGRGRHRRYSRVALGAGLPPQVRDRGPFEPLRAPEVLRRSDCVVVPSIWSENAPLVVLQARAAGVPILASDVPGIREVLREGVHGRLVPAGDARALAAAMRALVEGRAPGAQIPDPAVRWEEHLAAIAALHRGSSPAPRDAATAGARERSAGRCGTVARLETRDDDRRHARAAAREAGPALR